MRRLLLPLLPLLALASCASVDVAQEPPPPSPVLEAQVIEALPGLGKVPTRLVVGDIKATIVPIALEGSTLVPPSDPRVLGWWGRRLHAPEGTTLLTGHTVRSGGGALDDLELVPLGSTVLVSGVRYKVTSNEVISKDRLAEQAERLFNQSGTHRLVLVTCEDYDSATGTYASNVVMIAE